MVHVCWTLHNITCTRRGETGKMWIFQQIGSCRRANQMIPGLKLILEFVDAAEEHLLINSIDARPWSGIGIPCVSLRFTCSLLCRPNAELKRRTQMYGFLFSYRSRRVEQCLGEFPDFILPLKTRISSYTVQPPNMLLINEYKMGQGIMPHVDAVDVFDEEIAALSLLSPCIMRFTSVNESDKHVDVPLRNITLSHETNCCLIRSSTLADDYAGWMPVPVETLDRKAEHDRKFGVG